MATFFLILGIVLIVVAIFCFIKSTEYYYNETEWASAGIFLVFVGVSMVVGSLLFIYDTDAPSQSKEEAILVDSTVILLPHVDSITAIKFVIYSKEGNEIYVGNSTVLRGYTDKSIGDTITVNLP